MAGWGGLLRSLPTRKSVSFWVHKGQRTFPKPLGPSLWASTCFANRIMGPTQALLEAEIRREGGVEAFLPAVMNGKSMRQIMGKRKRRDEAGVCSLELSVLCTIYMLITKCMCIKDAEPKTPPTWAGTRNISLGFSELKGKHRGFLKGFAGRSFCFHTKWVPV